MIHKKLVLRTALSVSALSLLTACATSLAHRTPIDIASNSVRRVDTLSGVNEILAPSVKAFSARRGGVSGKAQLRTAGPFTDDKGIVQRGGAYLDVLVNYATATPNPEEARLYNQVRWAGGEPALLAEFGGSVLDCREDLREIRSYPSSGYGYYGGIFGTGYGRGHRKHKKDHNGDHGDHGNHGDHDNDHDNDGDHTDHDDTNDHDSANHPAPGRPTRPRRPRPHDVAPQPDGPGTEPSIPRVHKPVVYRPHPAPRTTRPRPAPVSKPAPKPRPVSKHKPAVNRVFGHTNNGRTRAKHSMKRHLDYDPVVSYYDPSPSGYVVRRRCDRQENLRIFIPRERLDAVDHSGLQLYLRPKAGREEVLTLTANYIAGFKLAAYSPEGERLTIPGRPIRFESKPERPDPKKPIIYGEK